MRGVASIGQLTELWNRKSKGTSSPAKACVIKPSALGDIAQTTVILPAIKQAFPDCSIKWVINQELHDLLVDHPMIDGLIPFERRGSWGSWLALYQRLYHEKFDLVLDLQGLLRTGLMAAAARGTLCLGMETSREMAWLANHAQFNATGWELPAYQRYCHVASAFHADWPPYEWPIPDEYADAANKLLADLPRPIVAVHPGAKWETKRWPAVKFAQVVADASNKFGGSAVLIGGKAERELTDSCANSIRRFAPKMAVCNLTGQTSLQLLPAILKRVDCVLTNDSGPLHLAAAVGTPVCGVFTCTSAEISGPSLAGEVGQRHRLIATQVSCAASYKKVCPFHGTAHLACFNELDVGRVSQGLDDILAGIAGLHP